LGYCYQQNTRLKNVYTRKIKVDLALRLLW